MENPLEESLKQLLEEPQKEFLGGFSGQILAESQVKLLKKSLEDFLRKIPE